MAVESRITGRALAVSAAVLAAVAVAAGLLVPRAHGTSAGRGAAIRATDYAFSPSRLQWRAGRRVTLTIRNDSDANPGKPHELMVGRDPVVEATPFGPRPGDGYARDFFAGVRVRVVRARGLSMLMPGSARVVGAAARRYLGAMPGMPSMPGMSMGGSPMPGMSMGGKSSMPGMSMPGMSMPGMSMGGKSSMAGRSAGAPQGLMFVLRPGGSVTISFVVPNRPGAWQMGCFQGNGEHYTNGMKGTIDVAAT